jgi:hypothetical protein
LSPTWQNDLDSFANKRKKQIMHNVGKIDRAIRLLIAATLLILYFTKVLESAFFLFLPLVLVMTSLRRCCPLYAVLGFGTCGVKPVETDNKIDTDKLKLK